MKAEVHWITEEVQVWYVVTELHEPSWTDGTMFSRQAHTTLEDARKWVEVLMGKGWPGVKRAWVEKGWETQTRDSRWV
jgi:hypothetical protein